MSLVKLRSGVEREFALAAWLGPHADVVRASPGVSRYVVAVAEGDRSAEQWDAMAIVEFDSADELQAWLDDEPLQAQLRETREPFIERVEAFLVERHEVI